MEQKYKTKSIDLMPNRQQEISDNSSNSDNKKLDENIDEDDIFTQNIKNIEQSIAATLQAIRDKQKILYQPTFRF
ncbi:MAG: hypothetical protein B6229_03645 [Spirochaetaceae bacterium 4572_7]|nr:MAG: hypothetical protein B6229_03645 [Spirochaetaceae bacterium 4572_7]